MSLIGEIKLIGQTQDEDEQTPLMIAQMLGRDDIAALLK
jgi:ankyrin repeat protein